MTDHHEIRFTEAELDAIADRICKRILLNITPERHYDDHLWIAHKQAAATLSQGSTRRVVEAVVGTTFTAAVIAFLVWLGHTILASWGLR